jgi:hypothetical protein
VAVNALEQAQHDTVAALERLIRERERELRQLAATLAQLRGGAAVVLPDASTVSGEYSGMGIVEATERYLREVGTAQTTRELADALVARGLHTRSRNLTSTIYATLTNAPKKFRRTEDGAWDLAYRGLEASELAEARV